MEEERPEPSGSLPIEKPGTPLPDDAPDDLREKCKTDRAELTPRQTSDCAGTDIAELYQIEEDGGS